MIEKQETRDGKQVTVIEKEPHELSLPEIAKLVASVKARLDIAEEKLAKVPIPKP